MRVVVQRVAEARVEVDGEVVGRIGRGFLLLVGLAAGDRDEDLVWMAHKIAGLRIFGDADGAMNLGLADVGGAVLAISQFTLLGDCRKGRRPSFAGAMPPADAAPAFARFVEVLAAEVGPVETGRFGADMRVALVNDGPVTLVLDRG
jgi:D-tyrosyl-tRNA(Tyr) deacylase